MHLVTPRIFSLRSGTLLLGGIVLTTVMALTVACSDSDDKAPALDNVDQTGAELVNEYITLLQEQDVDGLEEFLSDAFLVLRANGSQSDKAAYLQDIPDIGPFSIDNVTALQAGDVLVVRWSLTVDEVINGQRFSGQPAPRLSTFAWEDGRWRLTSHANFNVPEQ